MAKDSILDRVEFRLRGDGKLKEGHEPRAARPAIVRRRVVGEDAIITQSAFPAVTPSQPQGADEDGAFLVWQILGENRRSILDVRGDESPITPVELSDEVDLLSLLLSTATVDPSVHNAVTRFVEKRVRDSVREIDLSERNGVPEERKEMLKPEEVSPPDLQSLLASDYSAYSAPRSTSLPLQPLPDFRRQLRDARSGLFHVAELRRRLSRISDDTKSVLGETVLPLKGVEVREKLRPFPSTRGWHVGTTREASRSVVHPVLIRSARGDGEDQVEAPLVSKKKLFVKWKESVAKVRQSERVRAIMQSRLVRFAGLATALLTLGTGAGIVARGRVMSEVVEVQARKKFPVEVESGGESVGYLYGERLDPENAAAGSDKSIPIPPEELKPDGHLYFAYQALMALEDQGHEGGLTDWIGVNPVSMVRRIIAHKGGGSSIADQTCGAMQDLLPYQFGIEGIYSKGFRDAHSIPTKVNDTVCGMGLATTKTPEEIAALYFTYAYLASKANGAETFARFYLQLKDGIKDSGLTIAHQIIMAAAVKYPYASNGSNWTGSGGSIVSRSNLAIERLVDKGVITREVLLRGEKYLTESQFEGLSDEPERGWLVRILKEAVLNSKPLTNQQISATPNGFNLQPKDGYEYLVTMAMDEARDAIGKDFREEVAKIVLTSEGYVQGELIRSMQRQLLAVNHPFARGIAAIVDENGRIMAAFSGVKGEGRIARSDGLDSVKVLRANQMGSLGKLFLAAAVAKRGYGIHDQSQHVRSFRMHLMRSEPEIVADAQRLGVTNSEIGKMIRCFGNVEEGERNYLQDAAMGMYYIAPADMLDVVHIARIGSSMPYPHVVDHFVMRDGTIVVPPRSSHRKDEEECVSLIHTSAEEGRPGTGTWAWFSIPLSNGLTHETRGTLHNLNGIVDVGKTGTYGKKSGIDSSGRVVPGVTNAAWVLVGTDGGHPLTGIFGIAARQIYDSRVSDLSDSREMINLESTLAGGNRPAEIARDTFREAKKRLK